mmetsp:Transcript_7339/g.29757  ORF Transcript_7339/g.29757 Transcript_7339/m.29757 type:complete len:296 (+) Transcript_7339:35-922(+)
MNSRLTRALGWHRGDASLDASLVEPSQRGADILRRGGRRGSRASRLPRHRPAALRAASGGPPALAPRLGRLSLRLLREHARAELLVVHDVRLLLSVPLRRLVLPLHPRLLEVGLALAPPRRHLRLQRLLSPLLLDLLGHRAHDADAVRVQLDHLRRQLVHQLRHLLLPALIPRLERVGNHRVVVGLARARNDEVAEPAAVTHPHRVVVRAERKVTDDLAAPELVVQVRRLGLRAAQRLVPNLNPSAVPDAEHPPLRDVDAHRGNGRVVAVNLLVHANVPRLHLRVRAARRHVPPR